MDFLVENLGKIGFEWKMATFNLINFFILFLILKKYFFKPIVETINERQKQAKESVDNVQKAKTELQMAESKAQDIVDKAKVEANSISAAGHEKGKEIAEEMKTKARDEIEKLISQAKRNMEIDRKTLEAELRSQTASLVVSATEKVIGEKLDSKKDETFVKDVISTL